MASGRVRTALAPMVAFVSIAFGLFCLFSWIPSLPNGCELPYMHPSYTKIAMWHGSEAPLRPLSRFAARYRLLHYREGGQPMPSSAELSVSGTPVLFVPGNAGNFRQVRSLAMEASKLSDGGKLDFFTFDFGEELSGVSGSFVEDQAEFLNDAIRVLTVLYKTGARARAAATSAASPAPPPRFIVVAHSMGGLVARAAIASAEWGGYRERSVSTLLTIAAPHVRAPLAHDGQLVGVYNRVNAFWRSSFAGYRRVSERAAAKALKQEAAAEAVASLAAALANCTADVDPESAEQSCAANATNAAASTAAAPAPRAPAALSPRAARAYGALRSLSVASIGGGSRDALVAASLADVQSLVHPRHGFAVLTASIPTVGVSVDHQCAVWCKQLVARVAKALRAAARAALISDAAENNPRRAAPSKATAAAKKGRLSADKRNATRADGASNETAARADAMRRLLLTDASRAAQWSARVELHSALGETSSAVRATVEQVSALLLTTVLLFLRIRNSQFDSLPEHLFFGLWSRSDSSARSSCTPPHLPGVRCRS